MEEPKKAVIMDFFGEYRHQDRVIQTVKTARNVPFYKPRGAIPLLVDFREGSVTSAIRAKTVRGWAELRFVKSFQDEPENFLKQFVGPGWHAEWAFLRRVFL